MSETKYPEHEKMKTVRTEADTTAAFLEWMYDSQYEIAVWNKNGENMRPARPKQGHHIEGWLAMYFDIDLKKISDEKDQMYAELTQSADH